ncbi:MAG: tetratricopeptide repeat protein [Nitrospirota bacterium]
MRIYMRIISAFILVLAFFSFCMADDTSLEKAYSLYNQGKMESTIKILKDYIKDHPDPKSLYFLGYAYYKTKKMDLAMRYFDEAYLIDPNFSPQALKEKLKEPKGLSEDKVIKDIESKVRKIKSYSADIIITSEMMGQMMLTEGELLFKKPDSMRMEMFLKMHPEQKTIIVSDGQTTWTYMPAMKMAHKIDIARMEKEFGGLHKPGGIFEQHSKESGDILNPLQGFNKGSIKFTGVDFTTQGEALTFEATYPDKMLEPRSEQWGFTPSKAMFWISKDSGVTLKMDVFNREGIKMMSQEYKNIKLNPQIADSAFTFVPPEGTQVMDLTDSTIDMMKSMTNHEEPNKTAAP